MDGFGAVVSQEWFWDYHHKLGHGILAGVVIAIGLALLSRQRMKMGAIYLGLFHLHLVMDYFGSGQGWEIFYLWPMSNKGFASRYVWDFYSWQNLTAAGVLLGWTVGIIRYAGRMPLEVIMPSLDRRIVQWMTFPSTGRPTASGDCERT